jgi:hypothetical protein
MGAVEPLSWKERGRGGWELGVLKLRFRGDGVIEDDKIKHMTSKVGGQGSFEARM